jgi:hypothetical protein
VIDWIHRDTANGGTNAKPAASPCFAERLLVVVAIAHETDRGAAVCVNAAELAGRHFELRLPIFHPDQFKRRTSSAGDFGAATWDEFNRVHLRGRWNQMKRKIVTNNKIVR